MKLLMALAIVSAAGCSPFMARGSKTATDPGRLGSAIYTGGSSITLAGDLGNTAATPYVVSITGPSPIPITPPSLSWVAAAVTPGLAQIAPTTDVATTNLRLVPQVPYASAVTNVVGGNLEVDLATPLSGTVESYLQFKRGTTTEGYIGPDPGATSFYGLWFGSGISVAGTDFALYSNGSSVTGLNTPTGGTLTFTFNGSGSNESSMTAASTVLGSTATSVSGTLSATGAASFAASVGGKSGTNAFNWCTSTQALTSGTGNVLANTVYNCPHIKFTGTLTGAGTTVTLPATDGACWDLDFSAIVTLTDSISLLANSQTWGTPVAGVATEFPHVCYSSGVAALVGTSMTK